GTLVKGASVTITRTLGNGAKATDSNILEIAYPAVVGPANAKFTYKFNTVEGTPVEIPPEDFPVHLNVGKMIDMVITFTEFPREIADLATFHIVTNDPDINMGGGGSTLTLTLNAKAALPVIDVTPAQVDIGNCKIGTTCTETVTICNKGADVLSVSDLSGFVKKTEGFSTDPVNLVRTLAIGDCFTVKGNFNNAAVGLWNDVLNILSDDTVRSPLEVPFAAEAVDPQLTVTVAPSEPQHPLTMDFENVYTGEPHDPGIVMVENGGAGTLTVSAVTMDPSSSTDYSVKDYRKNGAPISGCPVDLTGTDILDFKVGLAPSVTGWIKGALTIASNGVGTPNVDVNLQAYGWNRDGKSCSSADQCESGFCINSRCCAEDCATSAGGKDIECWRCDVPGHEGTCTDAQPGLTCKDPFCADHETLHQKNSCDGAGLCKEGSEQDCTPFACASGACNSTCTTHGQCADMYSCCLGTCIDRFTPENQCQGALYLGTGGGETYCNLLCNTEGSFEPINTVTGKKSKWFKAEIQNCTKCTVTLNHQIKFRVPAGIIYQIRTFWGCGGTAIDTFRVTNTEKVFKISKPRGTTEKGDKFNYWIQIEYVEGASCEDWRLEVDKSECGSGC
ncbi:MAG: choice-of-anchor D domain-containing protein, partial [Myxococcota bacterium]